MNLSTLYHEEVPAFIAPFLETPEMARLRDVGMNCGCEYTSFPRFAGLAPYSRFDHSLGCALIVWHFTKDPAQTLAALFHDIATPAFAHAIDFLHGDYLNQESTEARTGAIIRGSSSIRRLLEALGLTPEDVEDYHRYPIADNDTPRLSADRLEYTLGNLVNFGFQTVDALFPLYGDILVGRGEDGAPELAFSNEGPALTFAMNALECSRIYVSGPDRWSMQALAELIAEAVRLGAMTEADLYATETHVISRLTADARTRRLWERFRATRAMVDDLSAVPASACRVIPAKLRRIDPLVTGKGRLSRLNPAFRDALEAFTRTPLDRPICGV